jgi:hypothetical protein
MNLEKLNFSEMPLSREDLLRIKGGTNAMYTVSNIGDCQETGSGGIVDWSDGQKD